jgi:hypothetical protein
MKKIKSTKQRFEEVEASRAFDNLASVLLLILILYSLLVIIKTILCLH